MTGYAVSLFRNGTLWKRQSMFLTDVERDYWVRRYSELGIRTEWVELRRPA